MLLLAGMFWEVLNKKYHQDTKKLHFLDKCDKTKKVKKTCHQISQHPHFNSRFPANKNPDTKIIIPTNRECLNYRKMFF